MQAEEKAWFARHGVAPVNHLVVVSSELAASDPDAVRELFRMLKKSNAAAQTAPPFDYDHLRPALELIIRYAAQQRLIPRAFSVDELFDDVTRGLR